MAVMNLMYGLDSTFKILAVYKSVGHSHVPCTCIYGLKFYQEYVDSQSTVWSLLHMCFAGTVWELIKAHNSWLIPGISLLNFFACPNQHLKIGLPELLAFPVCLFVTKIATVSLNAPGMGFFKLCSKSSETLPETKLQFFMACLSL